MQKSEELNVELVTQGTEAQFNGISRYTRELYKHLQPRVSVRMLKHDYPRLARHVDPLYYFPTGVIQHQPGSLVHFVEDFGCSQMLWYPMRPAIATSHDLGFLAWRPEAKMHRALDRILLYISYLGLKRMDAVITVSEFSRQKIIERLGIPAERVFKVHSGNDNNFFKPVAGARAKLEERHGISMNSHTKILLYVGVEFPRKNLATIFETLKLLPPNVRLLKVGPSGGDRFRRNTQRLIADLQLENRVCLLGPVPDVDLPVIYSAADAYICASYLEGFGHPILEAMASGTPVVCSNSSSLPELTEDAAFLIPPKEATSFAHAVSMLLCDEALREQMKTRGLQRAASFSWEGTANRVTEIYKLATQNIHKQ